MLEEVKQPDNNILELPSEPAAAGSQYDAAAKNRFEFEIEQGGEKYDIAQVFKPLTDERYMKWLRDLNVSSKGDEVSENSRQATADLWDELIAGIENVDYPEGADFRDLIESSDKVRALNEFLAVAVVEPESDGTKKLRLGEKATEQTVRTECWFDGEVLTQTHVLAAKTFELEKEYDRIQQKTSRTERTRGLRGKPKVEYVPQDDRLGQLYDKMLVRSEGFAAGIVPLRFKTLVIGYVFAPSLRAKTVGK